MNGFPETKGSDPSVIDFGWGRRGAKLAAQHGDIIVIVDVLSFATSVALAIDRGAFIYPGRMDNDPVEMARRIGGERAVKRPDVPEKGRFSLSPLTYRNVEPGQKVFVMSPNGATCSEIAISVPYVFAGALVNARAVGQTVSRLVVERGLRATVIACGERERIPSGETRIRWAVEDYLGAGAILSYIDGGKSADAMVCEGAFLQSRDKLPELLHICQSGWELSSRGFGGDVDFAAKLNSIDSVPALRNERFEPFADSRS
jgi:2-phosphosulfolactate phosphatase